MAARDDDFQLQSYQDDLSTDDNASDPIMDEYGEDADKEDGDSLEDKYGYVEDFDDDDN